MLNIAKLNDLKIAWPIEIELDKGEPIQIDLEFKVLPDNEIKELAAKGDEALISNVVTGWKGIAESYDEPLQFNQENLSKLCAFSFFRVAAVTAYYEAVATFARKNSKRR